MGEVRTIIWVAREDSATVEYAALLGDTEGVALVPGERRAMLDPVNAPERRAWLNGAETPPYATRIPNRLVVATISSAAGAAVSLLGSDRLRVGGYWAGELGEVLLFNRELSSLERAGLESYLLEKWRPERAPPPAHYDAAGTAHEPPSLGVMPRLGCLRSDSTGRTTGFGFPRMEDIRTVVWVTRATRSATGIHRSWGPELLRLLRGNGGKIYQFSRRRTRCARERPGWMGSR
jgi:hypothetical protein